MVRIRIINDRGRISFSSDPSEMSKLVDEQMSVHDTLPAGVPWFQVADKGQSFRTYRLPNGGRALGVINPIENSPSCATADATRIRRKLKRWES
jgi:hypothetical protein